MAASSAYCELLVAGVAHRPPSGACHLPGGELIDGSDPGLSCHDDLLRARYLAARERARSFRGRLDGADPDGADLECGHPAEWVQRGDGEQVGGLVAAPVERGEDGVFADVCGDVDLEGGRTAPALYHDGRALGHSQPAGQVRV